MRKNPKMMKKVKNGNIDKFSNCMELETQWKLLYCEFSFLFRTFFDPSVCFRFLLLKSFKSFKCSKMSHFGDFLWITTGTYEYHITLYKSDGVEIWRSSSTPIIHSCFRISFIYYHPSIVRKVHCICNWMQVRLYPKSCSGKT